MTSRKRKNSTPNVSLHGVSESNTSDSTAPSSSASRSGSRRKSPSRDLRRRQLLERLEPRQLLAGPQLLGIQPNEGALITDGSVRDSSPRVLTFGFDEDQVIDSSTLDGIRITRAGEDGILGPDANGVVDDIRVTPGLVTLGNPNQNEVVVRFAETLPDDQYRLEVFGFDDIGLGITGLRNTSGELFVSQDPARRSQVTDFQLNLGALVESVVPQPVIRNADGTLTQNRNEIVVYFNEDPLFVENDGAGNPTERSAENPRFYQLLLTQDTVRTTDDELFHPDQVIYDEATHTARLIFASDINDLPSGAPDGHTWRLRLGTAVDDRADFILAPQSVAVTASAVTDFQHSGLRVTFAEVQVGEAFSGRQVIFEDSGFGGLNVSLNGGGDVVFDFGGDVVDVQGLKDIVASTPAVAAVIDVRNERNNVQNAGADLLVPRSVIGAPALRLEAAGETLTTSLDVGIFGQDNQITSFTVSESIDPQEFALELSGGNDDPGHRDLSNSAGELRRHISPDFGADTTDGITEIAYNFKGIFDTSGGVDFLNQITDVHKQRIREVLGLWAANIGVQFRETLDEGITFAIGDIANLQRVTDTTLVGPTSNIGRSVGNALNASLRIDPTFDQSAIVFSNQTDYELDYGEDFTRKATAGVGFLLGLEQAPDLPPQTIMALDPTFLNQSIDIPSENVELEPVFPGNYDIQHGQFIHRTDSVDIDLYRFEVALGDEDKVGQLTLETFAERSADSSLLDTNLSLFQEISAFAVADLGVGSSLGVSFHSMLPGRAGNATEIRFIQTDRAVTDTAVKVNRVFDELGQPIPNAILLDLPRRGPSVATVTAQSVVDAVNQDPFASSLLRASVTLGSPTTDISGGVAAPLTVRLGGGGVEKISQNDDYFSEDSRIIATLGEGVYYVGVTASGNDNYDPTIPGSGFGGRTQGAYDLQFKFEPQVDEVDVIRDRDGTRANVPGTPLDGDGDGIKGGVHNFWFETAPINRLLNFTDDGRAVVPRQEVTVLSGTGVERTYEFVPNGQTGTPGNIPVFYSDGSTGVQTPPGNLAAALAAAINLRSGETGVTVTRVGNGLEFVGERSIELSEDFRAAVAIGRNIFVDKSAGPNADGSLARPFNNIANPNVANAFGNTLPGDIVRIVGNGGLDGDLSTELDNFSYQIGVSNVGGQSLEDGRALEVPKGVTTMVDAGTILKMRASYVSVGSNTLLVDRSEAALQILGTPRLVQLSPEGMPISTTLIGDTDSGIDGNDDGSVIITSVRDRLADVAAAGTSPAAAPGDWGGLIFRRNVDQFEGRGDLEDVGVFLQRVNHAEIRYGGSSNVLIDSVQQLVNPIQIVNLRPTVTFNEITQSADSAISASPDSFQETSYQSPQFQQAGAFTADYGRVGPDINNNSLLDNSVNGLFIRVPTTANETPRELTVAGRFDDVDIVHVLPENLTISSSPGGSIQDGFAPSLSLVSARQVSGGELAPGDYLYKMTFVDRDGFESLASLDQFAFSLTEDESSVELTALPLVQSGTDYVSRRLYRAFDVANPQFRLVGELDASSNTFIDGTGIDPNDPGLVTLDLAREGIRGRLDASLVLDPGVVVKMSGTRIELQPGSVLLAEGDASNPIALTGIRDDRFGAGGTFDTNNDADAPIVVAPSAGDWAGVYAGPTSSVNFDNVIVSYAGGISLIEGGATLGFVPLQLQQAEGRITNSRFEFNDSGQEGAGPTGRFGRLSATPSTIFVRGSQPIIVGNTFSDNDGTIIDIDSDSLTAERLPDTGRQTGALGRFDELDDNFGPLIRFNRYEDNNLPGLDQITGLEIRGGTLATESVWDDTDIVHLLFDSITVDNLHSGGGLKLRSRPDESLVVKLGDQGTPAVDTTSRNRIESTSGQGTPNSATIGTGLTASGTPNDAIGRLGGSISILGLPDSPVVLTSYRDDSVGAGLTPEGTQFTDNNGDGTNSRPEPNDWRSILFDQYSSDRNVDVIPELELSTAQAPGLNGDVANAQVLGQLAGSLTASDEVLRLGFEVEGFLSAPNDVDTYSFIGRPGTEVWVDIDDTSFTLDTVIELLDADGNVLARSDNSGDEVGNGSQVDILDSRLEGLTTSLQARDPQYSEFGAGGVYEDFGTANPRDAGIHFTLTGNSADPNSTSTYFFRVRSASTNPDDAAGGLTNGGYRFQVRLTEDQEFPGSVVRYSDIRYANHGIHVQGLLGTSPLLGEASENEANVGFTASNDNIDAPGLIDVPDLTTVDDTTNPSQRAQYLGNLTGNRNNVISVAGELGAGDVVDFYQIDIFNDDVNDALRSTIFDIDYADGFNRPNTNISVFYDPDGEFSDAFTPRLILHGTDSNILDDLTSPNGENSAEEKLSRGSIKTGDPLVGPVTLEEGTYYVAVTNGNQLPSELDETQNPFVRREPINSVRRIAEQRFDPDEGPSTASGPELPELFSNAAIASSGFALTADQLPGHGKQAHYDGSFGVFAQSSAILDEAFIFGDAADFVGGGFRASSLDTLDWSLDENGNIGTDNFSLFFNQSVNTSRTIPHITIDGDLAGEQVDFYEFTVDPQLFSTSTTIIDIDFGFDPNDGVDPIDGLLDTVVVDPGSINTRLYLFREVDTTPGTYSLVRSDINDFFGDNRDGRFGSDANEDAFIQAELSAGTYVIGVAQDDVTLAIDTGAITIDGDPLPAVQTQATYQLHVSVDEHPLSATPLGDNNEIISFDRATRSAPGTLSSNAFDLTGYVASDLPMAYFNYRLLPEAGDVIEFRVVSAENPVGQVVATADTDITTVDELTGDGVWRQLRADLGNFAGDTDVRIDITYTPAAVPPTSADLGLSLDDMIVGFAERGESVFNTQGGNTTFFDAFSGTASEVPNLVGEYQLETRPGTTYAIPSNFRTELQADFDTNDRHNQSLTIVAPAGNQLADGDTFVIGDGGFNQTFEFTTTPGTVQFGNTPVLFNPSDSPAEIAESIRAAIALQTNIDIEASSAAGEDNEPLTDGRLSLSGSARGSFFAVDSVDDGYDPASGDPPPALLRDAAGNVLLLAILHDGIGDENYLRTQGQVIVDSNKISDVRAIGIWSEPGLRDFDPEDIRPFEGNLGGGFGLGLSALEIDGNHPFLQLPRTGNAYPGYARNLPTLNDSVDGGLAPGIVVVNNTIDSAGFAGVKVDGETAPVVIDAFDLTLGELLFNDALTGDMLEGTLLTIDAGGTRVIFEFEEINAAAGPLGSGQTSGNGVRDGHIPIYYRETNGAGSSYNYNPPAVRDAYSSIELATSIMQSIQGSPLVTNGLVELVTPSIGPSPTRRSFNAESRQQSAMDYPTAAVYLEGVSQAYITAQSGVRLDLAPVSESVQPFARIVNNTIYGTDGREALFPQSNDEPNDLISAAIDTKVGPNNRDVYTSTGNLGDNQGPVGPAGDVDFYRVSLDLGDRLVVDIDTVDGGANTAIQIFDERGERQLFDNGANAASMVALAGATPNYLDPASDAQTLVDDAANTRDAFADFFAPAKGVYYVGVSGDSNVNFDPNTLSGRPNTSNDELGAYTINMSTYAPRTHVISADSGSATGIRAADLAGATITVTQVADLPANQVVNGRPNQVTFTFGGGANPINLDDEARLPDIMQAISEAIDPLNQQTLLPNNEASAAPGPIARVRAAALGGIEGENEGIDNLGRRGLRNGVPMTHRDRVLVPINGLWASDFLNTLVVEGGDVGFGHDVRNASNGTGTTENYVFVENAAKIELNQAAIDAGLNLDPVPGFATDQLINETGVSINSGASPAVLNNLFINLHESLVVAESFRPGFGSAGADLQLKPMEVVAVANIFQYDEPTATLFNRGSGTNTGITTGPNEPSNINGGTDDFNLTVAETTDVLVHPAGDNFVPAPFSPAIDSNVDSLLERSEFAALKQSVGIPISNVLAPTRDVTGINRADNPNFSNTGQGSAVFGDRGSTELADFVGPTAIAEVPRDNDAEGVDGDPNVSFISLSEGVFEEFRIQLQDAGDASDPFTGSGIDNNTVVVPVIPGLRASGANVTVFEDDRLLTEGIDYTFNYDETKSIITLTPLAGIWFDDRAYRIQLNNTDRTVVRAPRSSDVRDGDQIEITDSNGGRVVFEIESGFVLQMPEPITLNLPTVGTNQGGLSDGGVFTINDGTNAPVVFEFDTDGTTLPSSVRIPLPAGGTPVDPNGLSNFLQTIAQSIQTSIQNTTSLDVDVAVEVDDDPAISNDEEVRNVRLIIGAERGARVDVATSGLVPATRSLGFQIPAAGADVGGVEVGDTFTINDGELEQIFEFVDGANPPAAGIGVSIAAIGGVPLTATEVAAAIQQAVLLSQLQVTPDIVGQHLHLDLPANGSASSLNSGAMRLVSLSRTPVDGDLITFTPNDGGNPVIFEINRTDMRDENGNIINDDVPTQTHIGIDITRLTTGDQLAEDLATAIQPITIAGLNDNQVRPSGDGILSLGGQPGLGLSITPGSSLEVVGSPDVTGPSTLQIFGPLVLQVPALGAPADGDTIELIDDAGGTVVLEFDIVGGLTVPGAVPITFNGSETQDDLANLIVAAIGISNSGIAAVNQGGGEIRLGQIDESRVNATNSFLSTRRGIVADGEVLTIIQGGSTVTYEFESVNNGGGVTGNNIPVPFQPGSTPLDVSNSLAAAINNNSGGLRLSAEVRDGLVALLDLPGTVVDVTQAPGLILTGVPGGAVPVNVSPGSTREDVKQALLNAINSVNDGPDGVVTTLSAQDRGGDTLFVENGLIFEGPITSFVLPAIRDLQGNPLEANRADNTTQFTILMPTVGLDFGDAPDPVGNIPGRYPTELINDGARHVVTDDLYLGTQIDVDAGAQPSRDSDGDDAVTDVTETGSLFSVTFNNGEAQVNVNVVPADPLIHEGNTITINTGVTTATLEFDTDNRFDEDHFPIQPTDLNSVDSILQAIEAAIIESPVEPAGLSFVSTSIVINGDDEDGINFVSSRNPGGVFNRNVVTPIEVTVTGSGILQGWIDYDADGDWSADEQVVFYATGADPTISAGRTQVPLTGEGTRTFTFDTFFPQSSPDPLSTTETAARFRISKTGDLLPTGLSLNGEVEDYQVLLVAGNPPTIADDQRVRSFSVNEDGILQALDSDGNITGAIPGDDGLLARIIDPDGDNIQIVPEDAVVRTLTTENGTVAGELDLELDGTFTFRPAAEFNGVVQFTARVTDIKSNVAEQLVAPEPIVVSLNVVPVNDAPTTSFATVEFNEQTDEDQSVIFTAEDLIDPFYSPGPQNESDQLLVFQSVSSTNLGDSVSSRGGILEILAGGRSVRYTPPVDFNGSETDEFNFVVADVPGTNQIVQSAAKPGTVSITVAAVNDAPITGDDFYNATEDTALSIAVRGSGSIVGILDNDVAGPLNETQAPENQTIDLVAGQFPVQTLRGGVVRFEAGQLVYSPPGLYSGPDGFTYQVVDNLGAQSTGSVSIVVGGENDAPRFEGVDGLTENGLPVTQISLPESKPDAQSSQYDLNTWFSDPENDALTFSVASSNSSVVQVNLDGSTLTLTRPAFAFGTVNLTVVATDATGLNTSQNVSVSIVNENDSPLLTGALDPQSTNEDQILVQELSGIFSDPDGDNLSYTVTRLGGLIRPSASQIADHPLLDSITFVGDEMRITPAADQSGSVFIEIEASDGSFRTSDSFTLTINPLPDAPIAGEDGYNVAVGSTLRVLNPAEGLLRNDSDADGETILVDLTSVTQPQFGTLEINSNGTFVYVNTTGTVGERDSFQYRAIDSTGRVSDLQSVSLNLGQSQYQNPIPDMQSDVTADGFITPIDALRVINLLGRLGGGQGSLAVSAIGTPPPDFVDVNGDGEVTPLDALTVINTLAQRQADGSEGEGVSLGLASARTTAFASQSSDFLPISNLTIAATQEESNPTLTLEESTDVLLAGGLQIESGNSEIAVDELVNTNLSQDPDEVSVDDVLSDWGGVMDSLDEF